jgi:hypothetical protein
MGALTAQDLAFLVEMRSELRQAAGSLFKLSYRRPESCGANSPTMNGPPMMWALSVLDEYALDVDELMDAKIRALAPVA